MLNVRMPASMTMSLALHAGAFMAYFYATKVAPSAARHFTDVGFIEVHHEVPPPTQAAAPKPKPAASTFDFLKMALPSVPKIAALDVEAPKVDRVKPMLAAPKLEEKTHKQAGPIMPKLDLGEHRAETKALSALDMKTESRRAASLAAMPRLEDVGVRKVKNLGLAEKLEERRREAVEQQTLQGLNVETHRHVAPAEAMKLLEAAPPEKRSALEKQLTKLLPPENSRGEARAAMEPAPDQIFKKYQNTVAPPPKRSDAAALGTGSRKAVEIEGALKNRQVVNADVPPYPDRLKSAGIPEVVVKNAFCVDPSGEVVGSSIRTVGSSGFGWLDRLTQDSVRNWKFAEIGSGERQCGAITFRFELE